MRIDPLDLVLAAGTWTLSFFILRRFGTWLPFTLCASTLALWTLRRNPGLRAELTPTRFTLGAGLLGAAAMIAVTFLAWQPLVRSSAPTARGIELLYALLQARHYPPALLVALLVPTTLSEEVVFRGRFFARADGRAGFRWPRRGEWLRLAVGSLAYAACHLASANLALVLIALLCGLYWGFLRLVSGSLVPSMIAHALWDLAILVVWPLS